MRLKSKIKKVGIASLNEHAKNPYQVNIKKTRFPLWAKISIPITGVIAVATTLSIVLVNSFAKDINQNKVLNDYALNAVNKPFNNEHIDLDVDYIDAINKFAKDYYLEEYKYTYISKITSQELHKYDADYNKKYYEVENMLYSPISISNMLYMLYDGASGLAKQEIKDALYIDESKYNHQEEIKKMNHNTSISKEINDRGEIKHVYSDISQAIFIDENNKDYVNNNYLDLLSNYYYSEFYAAPINLIEGENLITNYINEKTHNSFSPIIDDGSNSDDGIINNPGAKLVTTTYLESNWNLKCINSAPSNFINYDNSISENISYIKIGEERIISNICFGNDYILARLPLIDGYFFNILFPNEDTDYQEAFNNNIMNLLNLSYTNSEEVHLFVNLPTLELTSSLKPDILYALGLDKIFSSSDRYFDNILSNGSFHIDVINSTSYLEVNEKGIIASTVTNVDRVDPIDEDDIPNYYLNINHPFMFSITNRDNLPLYIGQIQKL